MSCEFVYLKTWLEYYSKNKKNSNDVTKELKLIPQVKFAFILKIAVKLAILSRGLLKCLVNYRHETELRNGVIVYVAIKDHKLAVWVMRNPQ